MFKLKPSHHRRPLCQACDQSPAAFLCKADDASLCAACDADIHSANPLARRHHRIPILDDFLTNDDDDEEDASWMLQKNNGSSVEMLLFGGVVDDYLDLDDYNNNASQFGDQFGTFKPCPAEDSVVPIQGTAHRGKSQLPDHANFQYDAGYTLTTSSVSPNVSMSSMEVGIVPEASSPNPQQRPPKGTIDLFTGCHVQMPNQLSAEDREARVLRYREKKKNRKFEKTIRYASRKAYAEIRPRIKGRFAKRNEDAGIMSENGAYGIVPSVF